MAKYKAVHTTTVTCPVCEGAHVIKHGKRGGYQRYLCRDCKKAFNTTGNIPGRRFPPEQVGAALGMFYNGMSYKQIAENMEDMFDITEPSKATIYEWVKDYTDRALDAMKGHKARTGDEWVADEMMVRVGGEKYWLWNVMDSKTRYILAAHLSKRRDASAARAVMRKAAMNADGLPKTIKTDRLKSYIPAIEDEFGADVKHVQSDGITALVHNNLSERLQGTFRSRTKTMRGLDSRDSGQAYLDGWVLSYNLFREHEALKGKTPAAAAKVHAPFKSWDEAVERTGPKRAVPQVEVVAAPKREPSSKDAKAAVDTEKVLDGLKPKRIKANGSRSRPKVTAGAVEALQTSQARSGHRSGSSVHASLGAQEAKTMNVPNRTLFIADNLPVLRGIDSETVDLIATDPPFNKGVKAFEGITAAGENITYSDVWTWGDVQAEWTNRILGDHPALYNVIQAANAAAGEDMGAFLCWLSIRVLEMHRVLKPSGSFYLHIDHTAHAYVKAMLDAVFGRANFRNEIVWRRMGAHNDFGQGRKTLRSNPRHPSSILQRE